MEGVKILDLSQVEMTFQVQVDRSHPFRDAEGQGGLAYLTRSQECHGRTSPQSLLGFFCQSPVNHPCKYNR